MLARLQQALTLGALGLAGAWAWWALQAGHAWLAVSGAAALLGGYSAVLALEMALLCGVHGSDPAPRASAVQLLRAWWGEVCAAPAVFCWRQPFRSQRWPDRTAAMARGRRGVLLVHGYVCNRGLWNPWLARLSAAGTPFVAVNLEPVFGSIDEVMTQVEAGVQQLERCTGMPPVIVAHSMGGLVVRRWWQANDGDTRVCHALTLGSPHQGTWLARWAMSRNAREMRLRSPWLQALARQEPACRARRFTCFYSHCDNIVFPPRMATLDGADNRHLPGVAHVDMVNRPEPWAELQRWLRN
jgi:triacylglycerol esterase/lipase EstA (alpha/beta hydrolase family)